MLPARNRLRRSDEFRAATRGSRRAGRFIVLHAATTDAGADRAPRVGFVVSKGVGNAVHRNLAKRRLRHIASSLLPEVPVDVDVVIRARPGAAQASYAQLDHEVRDLLTRVMPTVRRATRSPRPAQDSGARV